MTKEINQVSGKVPSYIKVDIDRLIANGLIKEGNISSFVGNAVSEKVMELKEKELSLTFDLHNIKMDIQYLKEELAKLKEKVEPVEYELKSFIFDKDEEGDFFGG